jgi:outer membrane protein W
MKRLLFLGVFALTYSLGSYVNAQAVRQGNFIIDPYYGAPNFGKKFAENFATDGEVKIKGIGPMGARVEYMLADKFGVGVDFIYNSVSLTGMADSLNNDGTVFKSYEVKAKSSRTRIQARFNYHFTESDKVDAYFGAGVGTNMRSFKLTTDYPNYDDSKANGTLLPFSMRVCLGMRYYFTENIGMNAEMGLGGPIGSIGLSLKF